MALTAFAADPAISWYGHQPVRSYLAGKTRITRSAAIGHLKWVKRHTGHPQVMAALARQQITAPTAARTGEAARQPVRWSHSTAARPEPSVGSRAMWQSIDRLHTHHGEVAPEVRILKIAEECGEASAALIGMNGWNSRKGVCATRDDVLDELADVIITAAVAMAGIAVYDPVVTHPAPFAIIEATAADPVNGPHQHVDAIYVCSAGDAQVHRLDHHEVARARWVSAEQMRALGVPPELPAITEAALAWAASPAAVPFSRHRRDQTTASETRSVSMLGLDGFIRMADTTPSRAAHFESTVAYKDHYGEQVFTIQGPVGRVAIQPSAATRDGAWSQLWDIWIPPGKDQPLSALPDPEFNEYLGAWRLRSVFTQLGEWLKR